tara:strand:+ start:575 stop:787 length:213 start_codon:yes stop_codon:yes gene_type:complete
MSEELFYDYHCGSCRATYMSNEQEDKCAYCGEPTLIIRVKRPKIVRIRKQPDVIEVEPDYEWQNDVFKKR